MRIARTAHGVTSLYCERIWLLDLSCGTNARKQGKQGNRVNKVGAREWKG